MSHDEIAFMKLMQAKGLRVTSQRLQILDVVCDGKGQLTQGEILQRLKIDTPNINASTLYRNLHLLCELGLISKHQTRDNQIVYEIMGATPHHHLHCRVCGREYPLPDDNLVLLREHIKSTHHFTIIPQHLILEGICDNCASLSS
jgi:Fur family transcriptional regulator, ferric uptake regulator